MRRALALLATAAAATGWGIAAPAPAVASCAFVAVRHDRAYFGFWAPKDVRGIRRVARLAGAVEPGCSDAGGVPDPGPTRVSAWRIAGVSPDVALLVRAQVMIAVGYMPQLRGFPFHGGAVDETRGCRLGRPVALAGVARPRVGGLSPARVHATSPVPLFEHRLIDLFVDVHTRVVGLTRRGLPYVGDGQRVRIDAVYCGRKIVARRIVANGPIVRAATAEDILGADWRGGPSIETSGRRHGWWTAGLAVAAAAITGGVLIARRRPGAPPRG